MLEGGCLLGGKGTYSDVFYKEYCQAADASTKSIVHGM